MGALMESGPDQKVTSISPEMIDRGTSNWIAWFFSAEGQMLCRLA